MQHRQGWRQEFLTRCRTVSVIRNYSLQLTHTGFDSLPAKTAIFFKEAQFVTHKWGLRTQSSLQPCLGDWRDSRCRITSFLAVHRYYRGWPLRDHSSKAGGDHWRKPPTQAKGVVAGASSPTWLGHTVCGISKEQKVCLHHLLINGSCAQTLDTSSGHPWWDHLSDTVEAAC